MKHLDIKIYGNVQGVFFRRTAQEKARALGLGGYAKNQSDGSILIEIEGEDADVETFKVWCQEGPPSATVESTTVSVGPIRSYKRFDVHYI